MDASRRRALSLPPLTANAVRQARALPTPPRLDLALRRDFVTVVAELKRASPSKGEINASLSATERAAAYESGGAAGLSVITEPTRFGGLNSDVTSARSASALPILRKDFHVDAGQLVEARHLGASAALVIVRAVSPSKLEELAAVAREIGLEIVFEVRDEAELELALAAGARIVGVNNRNLETLVVDEQTVNRILPLVPDDRIAIAESGYSTTEQVQRAADAGADAVLVGSALSFATNASAVVTSLSRARRVSRTRFNQSVPPR